jgi:drug/metabolite transporter (DMT)-like permease
VRPTELARLIALAAIWGEVFLGEPVGAGTVIGGAVILLATALVLEPGRRPGAPRHGTIPRSQH